MSMRPTRRTAAAVAMLLASVAASALLGPGAGGPGPASAAPPDTGIVCTIDTRGSASTSIALEPTEGYMLTPDGNSVYMWSYGVAAAGGADFQTPGPVICADQGDTLEISLTVPAGWPTRPPGTGVDTPVSIAFPGQSGVVASGGDPGALTNEADNGETVTYTFTATEPGTYLYESGTNPALQIHMGLYGALVVYPTDGTAYGPGTEYNPDQEFLLVMAEVDPDLHFAVETHASADPLSYTPGDVNGTPDPPGTPRHNRYWTINGRSMPDTLLPNDHPAFPDQPYGSLIQVEAQDDAAPGPPALARHANAGLDNHPFHPHGNHLRVIAQDGRLLPGGGTAASEVFTKTVGAGQTFDLLARWLNVEDYSTTNPVPVTIPGLQNLVFVDDATYYSGNPVLGDAPEPGDFPAGVTVFNQCGEYYFPWHSHALFEFQNFDEGFGGLATLWRVDPPGGCP